MQIGYILIQLIINFNNYTGSAKFISVKKFLAFDTKCIDNVVLLLLRIRTSFLHKRNTFTRH